MILTIDIGNSSTKFGLFESDQMVAKFTIDTVRNQSAEEIHSQIRSQLTKQPTAIIISSVVKELRQSYEQLGQKHFKVSPIFIDHSFDFGFTIKYEPVEDCGSDRLVGAFAAVEKYGAPCIVCDFGTATNMEFVNENREYVGGIITSGINTFASALFNKTSKLPNVKLEKPDSILGNSTVSSIQSGIYFGYIGLVDGIIKRIIDDSRSSPKIISTGGFASLIAEESEFVDVIEENLLLEGLFLLHKKQESEQSQRY